MPTAKLKELHVQQQGRIAKSTRVDEALMPLSPLRPIFRDLAITGAELEISGSELQAIFVEMDLPELAITGPAIVREIQNAPQIKSGAGRVITATFHHSSGDVIDLVVGDSSEPTALAAGGPENSGLERHDASQRDLSSTSTTNVSTSANNIGTPVSFQRSVLRSHAASAVGSQGTDQARDSDRIGTTSNHPFWSVDRQEYVQAGQLAIGERLQTHSGDTKRVVSKLARPGPEAVYNLEVFAEHVYYVGKDGVLVHNSGDHYDPTFIANELRGLRKQRDSGLILPNDYDAILPGSAGRLEFGEVLDGPLIGSGGTGKVYFIPGAQRKTGLDYIGSTVDELIVRWSKGDHVIRSIGNRPPKGTLLAGNLTLDEMLGIEAILVNRRGLSNLDNIIPPLNISLKKNANRIAAAKRLLGE